MYFIVFMLFHFIRFKKPKVFDIHIIRHEKNNIRYRLLFSHDSGVSWFFAMHLHATWYVTMWQHHPSLYDTLDDFKLMGNLLHIALWFNSIRASAPRSQSKKLFANYNFLSILLFVCLFDFFSSCGISHAFYCFLKLRYLSSSLLKIVSQKIIFTLTFSS